METDSDGVETNTGNYVSVTNTGTDPRNDSDGDGLLMVMKLIQESLLMRKTRALILITPIRMAMATVTATK